MAAKCFSISKLPDDTGHSEGVCGRRGGFRGAALGRKQGAGPQGGASVTGPSGSRKGEGRRNPICRTEVVLDTVTLCAVSVSAEHELSISILQTRTRRGATRLAEVTKPVPGPRFPRLHSEARRGVSRLVLGGPSEDEYVRLALRVLRPRHHHGPLPSRRGTRAAHPAPRAAVFQQMLIYSHRNLSFVQYSCIAKCYYYYYYVFSPTI